MGKKKRKRKLSEITTLTDNFENMNLKDKSVSELTQNVANLDLKVKFKPVSFIEEYKPIKEIREKNSECNAIIIEGL